MNRERKQGSGKKPDQPIPALIERILDDVIATNVTPHEEWHKLWESALVPMALPTPDRRQYPFTRSGIGAPHTITEQIWNGNARYRSRFTRAQFDRIFFEAIGQAIVDCKYHMPVNVDNYSAFQSRAS